MNKLSPVLALSLATLSPCGGGSTGPTPAPSTAPAAGKVLVWSGTAQRTMRTQFGPLDSTTTYEISNVTWVRDDDDELTSLNGRTIYKIGSGHVKVTIRQVTGPCTVTGETEFDLKAGDGRLLVGTGVYDGSISRRGGDDIRVTGTCGFGTGGADLLDTLELPIDSANDTAKSASRLRGTKTEEIASSRHVSTWDFTASAWEP
jgi:hypothetical protein